MAAAAAVRPTGAATRVEELLGKARDQLSKKDGMVGQYAPELKGPLLEACCDDGVLKRLLAETSPSFEQADARVTAELLSFLATALQLTSACSDRQLRGLCFCALRLNPQLERAHVMLARCFQKSEMFGEAIHHAKAAMALGSPEAEKIWKNLEKKQGEYIGRNVNNQKDMAEVLEKKGDAPVKLLKGIGKGTWEHLGGKRTTILQACDQLAHMGSPAKSINQKKVNAILVAKRKLHGAQREEPTPDEWRAVLDLLYVRRLVVGSWNAMASSPCNKPRCEGLQRKAASLSGAARGCGMSLLVVQECPGEFIRRKGCKNAQKTLIPGSTFLDYLKKSLNVADKTWEGAAVEVPCGLAEGESHCVMWDSSALERLILWDKDALEWLGMWDQDALERPAMWDTDLKRLVMWDKDALEWLKPAPPECLSGAGETYHRAPVLAMFRSKLTGARIAVLCVHLKSGEGEQTREEVTRVTRHAVPLVKRRLAAAPEDDDTILVIGDFNLDPKDRAFRALEEDGFKHVGCPDGTATNQAQFMLCAEEKVYDSAWLWHRRDALELGGLREGRGRGRVVEMHDMDLALEDMKALARLVGAWQPRSAFARELLAGESLRGERFKFVVGLFKEKLLADWSDHRPICVEISQAKPRPSPL